jgi:hypothetical protein
VGTVEGNRQRTVTLIVRLDGRKTASETVCAFNGAHILTVVTTLPERKLSIEHDSAFAGHGGVAMSATHLTLGPPGHDPVARSEIHEHSRVDPVTGARGCVYEHVQVLLEHLRELGYDATIDVPDNAFSELERVRC